jgi:thioredoxin reductase
MQSIRFALFMCVAVVVAGSIHSIAEPAFKFHEDLGFGKFEELHGGEPVPYTNLEFTVTPEAQQLLALAMGQIPACQTVSDLASMMTLLKQTQLPPLCGKYFGCVATALLGVQKTNPASLAGDGASAVLKATVTNCIAAFPKNCEIGDGQKCPVPQRTISSTPGASTASTPNDYLDIYPGGDTVCALGQKNFHFRVKHGDPKKVVVYFEGGGGCWSAGTCKPNTADITKSTYKFDLFMSHHVGPLPKMAGILNGTDDRNPIKGWTQVFVPYCSGDAHGGDSVTTYTPKTGDAFQIHHKGQANVQSVVTWMNNNLPASSLTDLLITGCSAGALGAQLWSNKLLTEYESVSRASVLVDSYMGDAPAMWWNGAPEPLGGFYNWGADAMFPTVELKEKAKTSKNFRFSDMVSEVMKMHPKRAFAYLQSEQDITQRSFANLQSFGQYAPMSEDEYSGVIGAMLGHYNCENPNFKSYVTSGSEHCWIHKPSFFEHQLNGVMMYKWVDNLINGDTPCAIPSELSPQWNKNFAVCAKRKNEWVKQEGCFITTTACAKLKQTGPVSRKESISSEMTCLARSYDVAMECENDPEAEVKAIWGPTGTFTIAKGETPTCLPPIEEGCWIERSGCARAGPEGAGDDTNVRDESDFEEQLIQMDDPVQTLTQIHHGDKSGFQIYKSGDKAANSDKSACFARAKFVSDYCGNGEGSSVTATWGATGHSQTYKASPHRPVPLTKDSTVAIIGAGPAGVHMASLLKKAGVANVKLLEKTARLGGKSYTVMKDGVPHEMGTCYLHNMYGTIRDLLKEYEIETTEEAFGLDANSAEIVPEGDRAVFSERVYAAMGIPKQNWGGRKFGLQQWIGAYTVFKYGSKYGVKLDAAGATKAVGAAILKYVKTHHQLVGDLKRGVMPEMPTSPVAKAAIEGKTFGEFLENHGMEVLIGYLELAQSAQGYGLLFEVPALYGLWWIHPEILLNTISNKPKPSLTMLKKGYHQIWKTIADKHQLDIVYEATVKEVTRNGAKPDKPVTVKYAVKNGDEVTEKTEKFDWLVLAAPHRYVPTYVKDTTEVEREIFAAVHAYTLTTTLYESSPVPNFTDENTKATIAYSDDNLNLNRDGHWYCDRYSKPCIQGLASADWSGKQARVSYQFNTKDIHEGEDKRPPFARNEDLIKTLKEDIAISGVTDVEIIDQFPWSYFPHFGNEALAKGLPWKLLGMQGNLNTWYIGSSACFESVHDVTTYNHIVLDRYSKML